MIFRFRSGSATPARALRNRSDASTPVTGRPRCRNASSTCRPSYLRRRPVSTKTPRKRSPTASRIRTAATVESTPPDSAPRTTPCCHLVSQARDGRVAEAGHRPRGLRAADVVEEILEHLGAMLGVVDLRVPLDAVEGARGVLEGGDGRVFRRRRHGEARRSAPRRGRRGSSRSSRSGRGRGRACRPRPSRARGRTRGPARSRPCRRSAARATSSRSRGRGPGPSGRRGPRRPAARPCRRRSTGRPTG